MQLEGLKQLVEAVGWEAALKIVAVWGGRWLYVPDKYSPEHITTRILGEDAAIALVQYLGSQSIRVPRVHLEPIRLEANILRMIEKGFTLNEAGDRKSVV